MIVAVYRLFGFSYFEGLIRVIESPNDKTKAEDSGTEPIPDKVLPNTEQKGPHVLGTCMG